MAWTAEIETKMVFPVQENRKTGEKKRIPVKKTTIFLLNEGMGGMSFGVGRGKNGHPVITDLRETQTGAAQLTNRGPLKGEQYCKCGPVRKLTVTGWITEVSRLIGADRAREVIAEL